MAADIGKITKAMNYFQTHSIELGILGTGNSVPGLSGETEEERTVLEYATKLEFGSSKFKPFGFFRNAIESNEQEIQNKVEDIINEVLAGNLDGRPACMQLGEFLRGLVVESIATAGTWARPVSSKYAKWKAKNYPNRAGQTLILNGFLIKSIRYKIKKDKNVVFTSDWAEI